MPDHYDVIIIGTGAGGGTLAHTLAASGKRILLLERGNFLPRETENWDARAGVRRRPVHLAGHVVRRRRQALPAPGALLRRRRDQAVRRRPVPAAPAGLRRAQARRRRLAGVAGQLRRLRAVVHEGRVAVPGARQPRRGPDRGSLVASSTRGRRCPTSRGSRRSPTTSPPPATTRSRRRAGSCSTRPTGRGARASAAPGATATRAWCTPSPTPRRSPSARCSIAPNVTLLVDAEVREARDRRHRPHGHEGRRVARRRDARCTPPTSSSSSAGASQQRQAPAAVGERAAPERAGQRLRPGRPELHVPQLQGRRGAGQGAQRHRLPEDARHQRLLLRRRRRRVAARQHPDGRQVQRLGDEGRGAEAHEARARTGASTRWPSTPSTSGSPPRTSRSRTTGSRSTATATSTWPTPRTTTTRPTGLYDELKKILNHIGMAEHHVLDKNFYMNMNIPIAGVRAPGRHLPVRHRPGDVGARRELQGPRARQPLRRRHELLPEHRRGEPGPHRDGERHPGRRAPRRPTRLIASTNADPETEQRT